MLLCFCTKAKFQGINNVIMISSMGTVQKLIAIHPVIVEIFTESGPKRV